MLTLDAIAPGRTALIRRLMSAGATASRLLDFGFVPGGEVAVVGVAPLGDPITLRVGDDTVALRREVAARIEVVAAEPGGAVS